MMNDVIFREYDIRGVVNKDFDAEFASQLGQALISYLVQHKYVKEGRQPTITVGCDARISSPELVDAIARGVLKAGGKVIRLGLITSPISYFSTFYLPDIHGAIMVTGSHNPPEYNGFKISAGKGTLYGDQIQELGQIIRSGDMLSAGNGTDTSYDIFNDYVERYKEEFGQLKAIPVVVDCGNGAAGCIVRRMYQAVGLNPKVLFEEPDGTFPNHHPDPTVAKNLTDLIQAVKDTGSSVGIGFDGDADRIGVVDEKGNIILGDELMALFAKDILSERPGEKIIGDVKCSDRMYESIQSYGGKPIMWKTGHSLIKVKIKEENAPFGGELSGHIFFNDRNYGYDDALYAGLRLVEILGKTGQTIGELLADLPKSYNTPEIRVDTTEEKKHLAVTRLKEAFAKPGEDYQTNLIDGVRISFKDGWALARASNTQPVLVLRFESTSQEGLERIRHQIESVVQQVL